MATPSIETNQTGKVLSILLFMSIILSVYIISANANSNSNQMKILTWWGYLSDKQKLSEIESKCDVNIEVTEFMNVDDMMAMASVQNYDLYIYPWGYHMDLQEDLPPSNIDLTDITENYHPKIKEHYISSNMPQNTLFFQHAVRMFVYDNKYFPELRDITAESIINASQHGKVFLMNEVKQMDWLLKQMQNSNIDDNWNYLYGLIQKNQLSESRETIGFEFSNFGQDYINNNLLLGFLDSGEVLNPNLNWDITQENGDIKKLAFGFHPELSQVSSDVISVNNDNPKAECLAREMGSRQFLEWISEENYYFSPFEGASKKLSPELQAFSRNFYAVSDKMVWLDELLFEDSPNQHAYDTWKKIRKCRESKQCNN